MGRSDFQVKVRGFRIELGEIEAAMLRCPGVAASVALVRTEGVTADRRVRGRRNRRYRRFSDGDRLRRRRTRGYMVPTAIVVLESLPLTVNGARPTQPPARTSPSREQPRRRGRRPPLPKRSSRTLFAEVLGRGSIGVDDSFFGLGGDSIMSIQLVSRAKSAGLVFTPRDVFEAKTVAGLTKVLLIESSETAPVLTELPGGEPARYRSRRSWSGSSNAVAVT
ncbi:phosphopantetheine-binding protein [Rhodococcus sp. 3Y1]